jgi:hypothetical protein
MKAGLALALVLTLGAGRAFADQFDSFTYDLTTTNLGTPANQDYVQVAINLDITTQVATITFDSEVVGGLTYLMHSQGAAAVNINATTWTVGSISGSNSFGPPVFNSSVGPLSNGGSGNEDGYGSFNQTITSGDGFKASETEIVFTVTRNTGGPSGGWAHATDVLTANGSSQIAAAQVGRYDGISHDFTGLTGYAGDAKTHGIELQSVTPEPSSMAIAALGALGFLGYGLRRRFKK